VEEVGVAGVPGSSFYNKKEDGRGFIRFAFCKKFETMKRAADRLAQLPSRV
jgi:aspartate/methionine/tyrosine aminotransferase